MINLSKEFKMVCAMKSAALGAYAAGTFSGTSEMGFAGFVLGEILFLRAFIVYLRKA